jgi:hypothetical protein
LGSSSAGITVRTVRPSTHQKVSANAPAPFPASRPCWRITAKIAVPTAPPRRWKMLIVVLARGMAAWLSVR